jgi:pilus assembly protein Flp/PilA
MRSFERFASDERGGGIVEYALVLALVAIATITVLNTLSSSVSDKFNTVEQAISGAGGSGS